MLFWGDAHRTPSNFGFVRLFQGKGPLVWVVIPAAFVYWADVVERRGSESNVLLFLTVAAGIGFSPSGVTLGVLLVGLFVGATLIGSAFRLETRVIFGLLGVLAYVLAIGLVMRFGFGHTSLGLYLEDGTIKASTDSSVASAATYTKEMILFVLGHGARAGVALLCAVALPFTLRASPYRVLFSTYSLLCTGLLLFPWTSQWLAIYSYSTMSWRWLYVVPFALGMVVAVDRIVDIRKGIATRSGLIVMALLLFVFASPSWVVSRANRTTVSVPSYKLDNPTQLFVRLYSPTSNGFGLLHVRKETHLEGLWIVSPVTGGRY